jgi:hypothetical protein
VATVAASNPFIYSHPLAAADLVDRDPESAELLRNARDGRPVWIYAPRMYGKTSLLLRALSEAAAREQFLPVFVDLSRVVSLADVTIRFERAYAQALQGSLREDMEAWLQQQGLGLSLGAFGISAKIQLSATGECPLDALHALLDLPLRIHAEGARRVFIALDEFQDASNIPVLVDLIRRGPRTAHRHGVASYVFAGSEPGLMKQLFDERSQSLYGAAVPLHLSRLPEAELASYLARFTSGRKQIGQALVPLLAAADGHPQRTMLLAHHLWEQVKVGTSAQQSAWAAAQEAALTQLHPEFDAAWRRLTTTQQRTLRAIIAGGGSPYRNAVMTRLGLEKPAAQEAVRRLSAGGDIEADGGKQRVIDPLFAEWIRQLNNAPPPDTGPRQES